jgi:uncharacterized protein YdeI (YjbR/CyaY-like superfamily)
VEGCAVEGLLRVSGHAADLERVEVKSRAEWRAWLEQHHEQAESIWLVTFKKAAGERHVPYEAVVEEALCFGWVDSLPRKLDDERSMLLLSPRKPGSAWSALNKRRAERMIAEGRMHPAGLAKIEAAKADGAWSRLDGVEALAVPDDLGAALAEHGKAAENFQKFPRSARRGILEWILQAKRPETRAKRIAETARLAAQNKRANQFR